ncbi:hypothetical protein [Portibacter marinus]|uniref:hypothetical protein n=1 Tax=Portibacter marinus TaxID=2898660 RepID=UPI001F18F647|nr:hypothetical protein [Portibacter marinus]
MKQNKASWQFEMISIFITGVLLTVILLPIFKNVPDFPFLVYNLTAIFLFFTFVRYLFLLRFTPFARYTPVKLILTFLSIGIFVYLMDGLSSFQNMLDEQGTYSMVSHLEIDKQIPLSKYIRTEMIFFGTGALIATFCLPFRMIISIWRVRNRNTV